MSLMTSMYTGVSGLQSSKNAINTTAHNLANVNTTGYVRQQAIFSDNTYNKIGMSATSGMQVGYGVSNAATSRVRDILLDKAYRKENGRGGFYEAQYEAVTEVETIVGETEGVQFQNTIENLWNSLQEMAKTPDDVVTRSELVMYAEQFLDRAQSIYDELKDYQQNLNERVSNLVKKINDYGQQIVELNKNIAGVEAANVERANDYRDERDRVLDELSKIVKISYEEDVNNIVTVKIEGVPFVTESSLFPMGTAELDGDKGSTYLSCVWPQLDNTEVFFLEEEISTANNNDIGELKGCLLARGDFVGKYTDIPQKNDYDTTTPEGQAAYEEAVRIYERQVAPSSVVSMQAMLDTLVNGVISAINDVMCPNTTTSFVGADGTVYNNVQVLDVVNASRGDDGELPPQEIFQRLYTDRYIEVTASTGNTFYVLNDKNTFGEESLYTIGNVQMNKEILEDYSKIPYRNSEGEANMKMGEELLEKWSQPFASLNPDNLTMKTFKQYYNEAIYNIGNRGSLYKAISENQVTATSEIHSRRDEISGVSSDEELTNMIKFQSAYNASSRYITVISDMLEHIIERLGA